MEQETSITPESRMTQNPDVVVREQGEDGALFFNPDTNQIRVVNSTGVEIWRFCDGERTLDAIVVQIRSVFECGDDPDVVTHVTDFVGDMTSAGFLCVMQD